MRVKAAFYPISDSEIPQAKAALERFKATVLEPMGAYTAGLTVMEITEPFDAAGSNYDLQVVKIDGHLHFNDGKTFCFGFGAALAALKTGRKVARSGWNGKGMFLYHVPANSYPAQTEAARQAFGDMVPYGAYIAMKTAQGNVVPWLANQTDMLADDWLIIE